MKKYFKIHLIFVAAALVFAAAGCKKDNSSSTAPARKIGDSFQGGIIAYILQPGDPGYDGSTTHGLIAATADMTAAKWYNSKYLVTGATATALGTGRNNSQAIVSKQGVGNYAATNCLLIADNFSDWYLPGQDELNKLYLSKNIIGNFKNDFYWTSSEKDVNNAYYQNFTNGYQDVDNKATAHNVRPVRSF